MQARLLKWQAGQTSLIFHPTLPTSWSTRMFVRFTWSLTHFPPEMVGADEAAERELRSSALGRSIELTLKGGAAVGRDFQAPLKYKKWMLEAGFVDVVQKEFLTPISGWPRDPRDKLLGKWASADWVKLIPATTKITHAAGMPLEEIPAFQKEVIECLTRASMRVYFPSKSLGARPPRELYAVGMKCANLASICDLWTESHGREIILGSYGAATHVGTS